MPEPYVRAESLASPLPLPGSVIRDGQDDAVLALWNRLCKVQKHPAYKALMQGLEAAKVGLRGKLRSERNDEKRREYRLRHMACGLPTDVMWTWGSMAVSAAGKKEAEAKRAAEIAATGQPPPLPPGPRQEAFENEQDAANARAIAIAADDMVHTEGWADFALLLTAYAWALDFFIAHCHESDTAFYQEARTQIVRVLEDVQAAIDRGVDATAWLSLQAERE